MIPVKRQEKIIDILKTRGSTAIEELARELDASQMTIRRDLEVLSKKKIATRNHGGASLCQELKKERSYNLRKNENIEGKKKIAEAAVNFVKPNYTLFLDAGTTALQLASLIKNIENITVVTADLNIALELCNSNAKVYILGGEVQNETGSILSNLSSDFIKNIYVDIAFISSSSISTDFTIFSPTFEKSERKRHFIQNSNISILLAEKTKFYSQSLFKVGSIGMLSHMITDREFSNLETETIKTINDKHNFMIKVN